MPSSRQNTTETYTHHNYKLHQNPNQGALQANQQRESEDKAITINQNKQDPLMSIHGDRSQFSDNSGKSTSKAS